MKIFISGPITGSPFYKTHFAAAQIQLEKAGYVVANPADNEKCGSWQHYMFASISQMLECDGVAYLADWMYSKGAQIEIRLAQDLGMPVESVGAWCHEIDHG